MFNKNKKAKIALKQHLTDLSSISNVRDGNNWKASLMDTLNLYIGHESSISKRLDTLYFTRKESIHHSRDLGILTEHIYDENRKEDFRNLIQNAIRYIEANGIHKKDSQKNFLEIFNNAEIISGIVGAILLVLGIGNYFGKLEKDREVFQLEKQKETLENKIQVLTEKSKKDSAETKILKQTQQKIIHNKQLIDSLQNVIYKSFQKNNNQQ